MNNQTSAAAVGIYAPKHPQARTNKKLVGKSSDSEFPIIVTGPLAGLPKRPTEDRTRFLTEDQIVSLANAFFFSETLQPCYHLITGMTLHLGWATRMKQISHAHREKHFPKMLTAIMHGIRRAMAKYGYELVYLYIWENGAKKGEHVHAMTNIPIGMLGEVRKLLSSRFGLEGKRAVQFSVGGRKDDDGVDTGFGMKTAGMRAGIFKYLLKGYDPDEFRYFGCEPEFLGVRLGLGYRKQGFIPWKRVGTSQNLGRSARSSSGWREIAELEAIGTLLHSHHDTSDRGGKPLGAKKDAARRGCHRRRSGAATGPSGRAGALFHRRAKRADYGRRRNP